MYGEFAAWWPLLSAVEEYEEEAAAYAKMLRSIGAGAARSVLELGAGGGNNAFYLKRDFTMTLTDVADGMLAESRRINPECEHFLGDMRSLRLGRDFDRVFVHDAVCYMTTREELREAAETAFVHCRPGGAALFCPDFARENFEASTECGGNDLGKRGMRYLEWVHEPLEGESCYEVDYLLVMREEDGETRVVRDRHKEGVFSLAEWMEVLRQVGFAGRVLENDGRFCLVGEKSEAGED
jgi:SAM-dependent methyltransferase